MQDKHGFVEKRRNLMDRNTIAIAQKWADSKEINEIARFLSKNSIPLEVAVRVLARIEKRNNGFSN